MKNTLILVAFFLNIIALSISIAWMFFDWGFDSVITSIGFASALVVATIEVTKKYTLAFKKKDLKVAMLGEPGAGKTVYVTVLFDELQKFENELLQFAPLDAETVEEVTRSVRHLYNGEQLSTNKLLQFAPLDAETIEEVAHSIERLYSGKQLPATAYTKQYSCVINYNSKPFKKQFHLFVSDWAGGDYVHIAQAAQLGEIEWLHQSDYFDYVLQSDIIFFDVRC